jgi:hypothetical protein
MPRSRTFALVFGSFALPAAACAAPSPTALAPQHSIYGERGEAAAFHQRNAGAIDGHVMSVDYKTGALVVQTSKGRMVVIVLPSTSIQGERSGFHTIADITKGARVHVLMSQSGSRYIAQIINLKN